MSQPVQSASRRPRTRGMRVVVRALLVTLIGLTGSALLVSAQNAPAVMPPAAGPQAQVAPISVPSAAPNATVPELDSSAPASGRTTYMPGTRNSWLWNQPTFNSFQPNPTFGNFSGSSVDSMSANSPRGFGSGRQGNGGFNRMGGGNQFGGSSQLGNAGQWSGSGQSSGYGLGYTTSEGWQSGDSTRGANGLFAPSPFGLPSLNQMMRGSYSLPLNSSTSSFRFTYQDALKPGDGFGYLAHPSASAMFSTSDLGNGVFLSAGTSYGHSGVGAPAVGANAAAGKHSGPSLGLKLSF